jgi:ABC-type polysaccharide/polyol phosphate transport system ATPase subunit
MSEAAIVVKDVSKKYRLFNSARDRLKEALHPFSKHYHREFWALRGVSFEVPRGQTVGILGRNGSGKSTLLQLIAGVMQPTNGEVIINGRVSALLELGAGFNPEFTGRENVFFQAQVLGVSREEINRRLPEIEAFAEIGEFFEQPVKTYSSGMFVRLAFAAAIHVDPDILIIDEALAVGDAKFQHKCFEHLADLRNRGKTILFVTHSTSLVTSYSERAFLIDSGELIATGEPGFIVDKYHELLFGSGSSFSENPRGTKVEKASEEPASRLAEILNKACTEDVCHTRRSYNTNETRFGNGHARIIDYTIQSESAWDVAEIVFGSRVCVYMKAVFFEHILAPAAGFCIKTLEGIYIYATNTIILGRHIKPAALGDIWVFKFSFPLNVSPGDYFLDLAVLAVDGTRGGCVLDVRRSIAHCVVSLKSERPFDGLVDLAPSFDVLTE